MVVDRLIARWEAHLLEKTLWRTLYETGSRRAPGAGRR
jgi:hypothetical protein